MQNAALWTRIAACHPDDVEADFPFSHRLARDNGWTFQKGITDANAIRVVSYGTPQLEIDGVLFNIVATVKRNIEGQTPLTVSHLMFNDGQPETTGIDGQIVVEQFVINSTSYLPIVSR